MKKNRVRGLLWVFFLLISGLRVAAESEAVFTLAEGETFSVKCPTSTWKYSNSRKAWQRLDGAEPVNLVITERPAGKFTQARVGKYFLEDKPTEGLLEVQVTNLQEEDSGLYRCVIYHPPKDPEVLFQPIRLVVTKRFLNCKVTTSPSCSCETTSLPSRKSSGAASHSPSRMQDRMEGTRLGGWTWLLLLLLVWFSGFQAEGQEVQQECLQEGKNLTVTCTYNRQTYATSLKAWQRLGMQGPPDTLVRTTTRDPRHNLAQAGRYVLDDYPTEAVFKVTVIELQRQDVGLYQCVIDLSPRNLIILPPRIRLVQCKGDQQPDPAGRGSKRLRCHCTFEST
ncbi:triggering receptor expressed on myeloid cells 1 isoform X2 [Talpa occidentalis]|uniref:triggering receptor expressed on myeloid cells 1 isoform X2 n=1 Tax=Talpa occidentalis TaxID=50954 RepID=UPI0023FA03CE|nr:triggering receptor expressed on myeloid cells 1 isoform X2 [Talpa occidentalis]